ncbi:MAG: NCS2 family permease [Candidatus Coatesbacteria bacterium]|nr:NCS2 family permease [Candidatus Coatesbacteria bacterium]
MLEKYFDLKGNCTTLKTEITAGVVTFMTMAYIVFVNPTILSDSHGAGMSFSGVLAATCLASFIASLIMGLVARYPIALAPGMGLNAYFSYVICGAMGVPWQIALGIVFISGLVFTVLTLIKARELIVNAIPDGLKLATAAGIGLFIAFIGLQHAGIVAPDPNTFVTFGDLSKTPALVALFGLILTSILVARKVKGAILYGLLAAGIVAVLSGVTQFKGIVSLPDLSSATLKLDILGALSFDYIVPIVVLLFFDMFDTIGTLIGVSEQCGLVKAGRLPRINQALLSDSVGTMAGAVCGTSTVTSYIESAAGVMEGGRTGLTAVLTGFLFLVAMFFTPLAQAFAAGCVTAPALVIVGCLMMRSITKVKWDDFSEAIPAFLTIILMPLTFSIAHGLALGFISFPILKLAAGKSKEVHWLVYILAAIFLLRYILI